MSPTTDTEAKFLVNCQDGTNDPERATIAFIVAFTSSKTHETAIFVSAEAADLCVKGVAENVNAEGYEPLADLLQGFLANGGKIWLCPACVRAKGIVEDDLIAGVEVAGAPRTMAFLASGGHILA